MALVDYPSSSDESPSAPSKLVGYASSSSSIESPSRKRKHPSSSSTEELPPLPSAFHSLYASTVRTSTLDDPALHGGRKRMTPHVDGNWPSHVYIEWYPSPTQHTHLHNLITKVNDEASLHDEKFSTEKNTIKTFLTSELGVALPLHISLSRPIGFVTEKKDVFLEDLERGIRRCGVKPFTVKFSSLDWVSNFEKTRWFLVLRLHRPSGDELNKLLHTANTIVQSHHQPPLYIPATPTPGPAISKTSRKKARSKFSTGNGRRFSASGNGSGSVMAPKEIPDVTEAFHFSIAWSLVEPNEEVMALTRRVMEEGVGEDEVRGVEVGVKEVKVKVGNVVRGIELVREREEGCGLFGL